MTAPTLDVVVPPLAASTWWAAALVLLVLVAVTLVCVVRARRLDLLHRRTDAARAGLADALERRGTVALRVADALARSAGEVSGTGPGAPHGHRTPPGRGAPLPHASTWRDSDSDGGGDSDGDGPGSEARAVREAAHAALTACRAGVWSAGADVEPCEVAENALTRRLAAVDRAALPAEPAEELADAEQLVLLARRVYNDAVRDTLDLRSRRLVRWLRLAGTAPVPAYFEIADPARRDDGVPAPFAGAATTAGPAVSGTGAGAASGTGAVSGAGG